MVCEHENNPRVIRNVQGVALPSVLIGMSLYLTSMDANAVLMTFGMVIGLFIYWRQGGNKASSEVLAIYKNRDELQDKQRKEMSDRIHELTQEVGRLNGVLSEKEARIKILESVDVSRSPVLMQFMEKLNKSADESALFMLTFKDLPQMMQKVNDSLQKIDAHLVTHV